MATACWSSLPIDLINRIAGCFLDTADLDCYMDFRAVCHNWRSATVNPSNTLEHRFRPHNWVLLDHPSHEEDLHFLVNTATGRFHVKNMPLLREYYVVSVTSDGLLVLAGRAYPHSACVLNPFTGYMVRFAARMRINVAGAAVSSSSPPWLALYCNNSQKVYLAEPDSESFDRYTKYASPLVRKAVHGCIAVGVGGCLKSVLPPLKLTDLMTPPVHNSPGDGIDLSSWNRCSLVESAGETLVVFKLKNRMEVFKIGMGGDALDHVQSIGNRAIIIGTHKGISVDADKFPSIEANCIYFTDKSNSIYFSESSFSINRYNLRNGKIVRAGGIGLPAFQCDPRTAYPLTIIQLLSVYTFNSQADQVSRVLQHEDYPEW